MTELAAERWLEALGALPEGEPAVSRFFADHPELRNAGTVDQLHQEVLRVLYADLNRATRLAQAASHLSIQLDDPLCRAMALRGLGHVSYAASRCVEAVRYYREAFAIFDALGHEQAVGRTLLSGLQSLILLGRYDEAYAWADRAWEIFERLGDRVRLARLASNIGNILYRQDRYAEALVRYEEAHETLREVGEPRDVAAVLCNIAVCQISLSRFVEALESYRRARDYSANHGLPTLVSSADYNIAYVHYLQGDFLRAIELYRYSRQCSRSAGDAYHAALCDLDEAEIYLEMNLNSEAAHLAIQAEAGFLALAMGYERAKAMVTHATACARQGSSRKANRIFTQARKIFIAEQNRMWPALIDLYRAMLLEGDDLDRAAMQLCRRASRALAGSPMPGRAALAELLEARLLLKSRRLGQAKHIISRGLAKMEGAGAPWLRFHVHMMQGNVEEESGNPSAAFAAFESARLDIEALRNHLWGDEPKISFLKDKLAVYECLVRNRLADRVRRKAGWADAFLFIQQAKSRSLAELISRSAPDRGGSDLSPHRAEVEAARRNLNAQHRRLEQLALSSAAPAQIAALREGVQESERVLQRLAAIASSETAADWLSQSQPLSVEQIQAAIPAGATLLEYYAVKGVLHVCLVRSSSLHVMPLAAVDQIKNSMRLLRFQIRRFRLGRDDRRFHGQGIDEVTDHHLRELETLLIAPLRRHLARSSHLIVAPHDFLHHLPFHALRRPSGYLIDEFTISYAPSATVYARCATRPNRFDNQALVLGLADPRAPSIELEAKAAAAALPNARLFLGHDATEDVLRRYGSRSRFLHIATHGLFRRDNPLFSAIRLGDMYLTLFDLYRLPLAAELVTLSGCSTGLNVVVGADELLGLVRGLLLAGAQGVMVSLWDVNDLSTAGFMRHFYLELQRNSNKAAAMRAAMRALREEYSHPYHWAPFQLAGKYVDLPAGSAGPQRIT